MLLDRKELPAHAQSRGAPTLRVDLLTVVLQQIFNHLWRRSTPSRLFSRI
jgi:hypothetical protein